MTREATRFHQTLSTMRIPRIVALLIGGLGSCQPAAGPADLMLVGGRVRTMNDSQPWAEAIAIRDGRIVEVGADAELRGRVGPKTVVIALEGRLALPGFIDAHVHPLSDYGLQLEGQRTRASIFAAIGAYAAAHPDERWVEGYGWDLSVFDDAGPRREWLDSLVPDRPALIWGGDGHSVWANTKALEAAGITRATPDPEGGRIERAADGTPAGTLREAAATLMEEAVPPWSIEKRLAALENSLSRMRAFGITGFLDASVDDESMLEVYSEASRRGLLTPHAGVSMAIPREGGSIDVEAIVAELTRLRLADTLPDVSVHSAKIFVDGVIEAGTAALLAPYTGTAETGALLRPPEVLSELTQALHHAGFQLHFHAIGDRAIRVALDAVEAAGIRRGPEPAAGRDAGDQGPGRPLIAHAQLVDPADVERFVVLGAIPVFSAVWAWEDSYIRDLTVPRLGPERSRWIYPMGTLSRAGAGLAFGSDWPVTTMDPLQAIEVAVTRIDPDAAEGSGTAFLAEERLNLDAALRAHTLGSAHATLRDHESGSLEAGKRADLIVLSDDLFAIPPSSIGDARVVLTVYGGRIVHRDSARFPVR